jgi:hypothetical protein
MVTLTPARRVPTLDDITQAGDYSGPHPIQLGADEHEGRVVWFLLPIHRGETLYDHKDQGSGLHAVYEPPWTFEEFEDGSVEVRASIGCGVAAEGYYWHGYLDRGNVWRQI